MTSEDGLARQGAGEAAERSSLPAGSTHALRAIEPPAPGFRRRFSDVWRNRHAFLYFLRRNIRRRYGRTFLGYVWILLPVVAPLLAGSLVYGGILGVSTGGVPYFLYFIVASGAWFTFSRTAFFGTRSLEITRSDLGKVYVPQLIPLLAAMALPVVSSCIYAVIAAGAVAFYALDSGEFYLTLEPVTLLVPVALAFLVLFGLACGLWFSPLAARARDVRRLAGYVLGFWYFLTPVIYPIEEIPSNYQFLASLNPVTAPVETVKVGLIGEGEVTVTGVAVFFGALFLVGAIGLRLFGKSERKGVERYY
jgi:lipopolysaccharide transport system permease protein